ncbi:MAG: hypothetical protein ACRELG_28375, partial [Gemmataceae bacterium]
ASGMWFVAPQGSELSQNKLPVRQRAEGEKSGKIGTREKSVSIFFSGKNERIPIFPRHLAAWG